MTLRIRSQQEIDDLEQKYKYRRIRCVQMPKDPRPVPSGTEGFCYGIDGAGHLMMYWDNGQGLNLIPEADEFEVLNDETQVLNSCSWCDEMVPSTVKRCPLFGHNPHVPRMFCDCKNCRNGRNK